MEALASRTMWGGELPARLMRWTSSLAAISLMMLAFYLLARRVMGAAGPLPAGAAVLAPLVIVIAIALIRRAAQSHRRFDVRLGMHCGLAATVLAFAPAMLAPGSSLLAIGWIWTVLMAGEVAAWSMLYVDTNRVAGGPRTDRAAVISDEPAAAPDDPPAHAGEQDEGQEGDFDESMTQRLVRSISNGHETIVGDLRAELRPGERTFHLHVAFCPPLELPPRVTAHQTSGPAATIKASEIQTYGARFDIRMASLCRNACSVSMRFEAAASLIDE